MPGSSMIGRTRRRVKILDGGARPVAFHARFPRLPGGGLAVHNGVVRRLVGLVATLAVGAGCGFEEVTPACYVYLVTSDTHTCARKTDGTLWCWGNNQFGQLGSGDTVAAAGPVEVTALA